MFVDSHLGHLSAASGSSTLACLARSTMELGLVDPVPVVMVVPPPPPPPPVIIGGGSGAGSEN